ncbi:hypothetical protein WR25_08851 [Diploscapter pachys]|uniref:MIT domain-containing protein n=1 Tax=Diploscapter pachys TaxID=2018661 RepID=A0A2A2JB41_9BILA|nr:hypothetical protein WR25_08851 [Diploscapter pachys]
MSRNVDEIVEQAKPDLIEAVQLDQAGNKNDALQKYMQGISTLMGALNLLDNNDSQRDKLRQQINRYMSRAEELKNDTKIEINFLEQRRIAANSTGHGYDRVFAKCINDELESVIVKDAYIIAHHQMLNFVRFCELLVTRAKKLKRIELTTGKDAEKNKDGFAELSKSLEAREISLKVEYSDSIHDREIRFNNGWIVKIGRGLDYFKNPGKYSVGSCDMSLRQCHETTIDIFKTSRNGK